MGKDTGPFSIGSKVWPGTSRVIEEAGELVQVLGKLIGAGGETSHWDGTDLRDRLINELGDVRAALDFFTVANGLPVSAINERTDEKRVQYERWHRAVDAPSKPS